MNTELDYKLCFINRGMLKGNFCIILYECDYVSTDALKWFKVYVNNEIRSISNNCISFL
jgi:hypothetical protein